MPIETNPTPSRPSPAPVSVPPASEGQPLEKKYAELLAENQKLRADLMTAQAQRDAYVRAWIKSRCTDDILQLTNEEILACAGRQHSLRDLIAELAEDRESGS